ncbi:molybdate ABC transporter, inner membrane subunit [Cellulomonas flavigena DSM 20109]|uniref:Molybdenum transport system permease n=1 Tax=Cellulomonas flavigena (strain ATCC 482 / DSM 20109 / BCRC 11376 / JCM 18109 / NBRC 3775 / NCIMB 8073 / NRS 134) TaxID=446466 RepID=D5UEI7_CELFN|nr:molybdate ABC transporter permease subunit [Cellulomonas flavigena]ADG74647.1 molybdate ABC transporter, inner membrane subunit [Cellulomonas flavigena DSM 20109]
MTARPRVTVGTALLGAVAAAGVAVLVLPLVALLAATPWERLVDLVADPAVVQALRLSLGTAACATALCLVLGVPLAWVLAHDGLRGTGLLRSLVTVPLVLPPVVGGVALLLLLGRRGLVGARLEAWFGVTVPFTSAAVVLAQVFVAMPFLVLAVEGALRGADRRRALAAQTLGASPAYVLRRVTLPAVAPGVAAGAALCFTRALGEFGATVTFAGSFPGTTRTVPLAVSLAMDTAPEQAVAMSVVLLALSVVVLVALRGRWVAGLPGARAARSRRVAS